MWEGQWTRLYKSVYDRCVQTSNDNAEDEYDEALEKREVDKALVDGGKMTQGEFIANALNVWPESVTDPLVIARFPPHEHAQAVSIFQQNHETMGL